MATADKVWIYLRGSPGVRGAYYGPGLVEVPRDVAETIAVSQGKSVEQLEEDAKPYREQAEKDSQAVAERDAETSHGASAPASATAPPQTAASPRAETAPTEAPASTEAGSPTTGTEAHSRVSTPRADAEKEAGARNPGRRP